MKSLALFAILLGSLLGTDKPSNVLIITGLYPMIPGLSNFIRHSQHLP